MFITPPAFCGYSLRAMLLSFGHFTKIINVRLRPLSIPKYFVYKAGLSRWLNGNGTSVHFNSYTQHDWAALLSASWKEKSLTALHVQHPPGRWKNERQWDEMEIISHAPPVQNLYSATVPYPFDIFLYAYLQRNRSHWIKTPFVWPGYMTECNLTKIMKAG